MIRGETITTEISGLPISVLDIKDARIVFHTLTRTILEKNLSDCVVNAESETIECTISQDESLRFGCGPITRSVVIVTHDGARFERRDTEMVCAQTAKSEVIL